MVDLKEPKLMLRDLSGEKLDEVHGSGYYDYLAEPEYVENVMAAVARMILTHAGSDAVVLDAGCGTGALSPLVPPPMEYFGFDASREVIKAAWSLHGELGIPRSFNTFRIEKFLEIEVLCVFDVIHFGSVLCCLIHPAARLSLVEQYVKHCQARFIVVSDLERLDTTPLKERFELLEGETFHLCIPGQPDSKQHRKVEIYRTGVKRDG